jgi:DNA primase
VVDPAPGHEHVKGRLSIPYMTETGVVDIKFRALDDSGPKYLGLPGARPRLYQASVTLVPSSLVVVTEGEMDALVMWRCVGVPAVGVPGANQWQPHWGRVLDGYQTVLVVGDGDEAGRRFAKTMAGRIEGAVPVEMPDGYDVNRVYVEGGAGAVRSTVPMLQEEGFRALSAV